MAVSLWVMLGVSLGASLGMSAAPAVADPQGTTDKVVSVSPAQARQIAAEALVRQDAALAAQIAKSLIERDPADADAHYTLARALGQLQQFPDGRRAARLAYRHATNDVNKFYAAQLAAEHSIADGAPLRGQYWLRRSLISSPSDQHRAQVIEDYRTLRILSPWTLNGRFLVAPSSNLNNGASDDRALIDGVPIFGILSGSAQALSGTRSTADVSLSYRLSRSKTHMTAVSAQYFGQRVSLSDEAKLLAPSVSNADLSFDRLELRLNHDKAQNVGVMSYEAGIGRSWYGGDAYQNLYHLGLSHRRSLRPDTSLQLSSRLSHRVTLSGNFEPVSALDVQANLSRKLTSGDRLTLGVALHGAQSDTANSRLNRTTGYVNYSLANPIGPATISAKLGATRQNLPDYSFGVITVPGGRKDNTVFGSMDLTFKGLDYAGFVPSLRVQVRKTRSNVSKFQTNETSVSLGVTSSF
ncbi:MAG: bacterial transcriptional activator domain-containing protein [Thalassovita sp.]